MTSRRWIFLFFATIVSVIGLVAVIAYASDPYGVLRDPSGRKLAIYFAERKAKFLMSKRYVPANFQGLIVGPSSSANWDVPVLDSVRMFNESLDGANATEEQIVVNQALRRGHYKLAVFILHPIMTSSHDVKEGLDKVSITESFGSIHVFVHEAVLFLKSAHIRTSKSNTAPNGQLEFNTPKKLEPSYLAAEYYQMDPLALQQYREMVQAMQSNGANIIYVVPPLYEPCYQLNKPRLDSYIETIRNFMPPAPVINFNASEYSLLRSDPNNFIDCFHVEPEGAAKINALLVSRVRK